MEESWLQTYLRYTQKHEAPELFHKWVGLTVLSAVLGRKVWLDRGFYTLYPNLFTVLVAGSARCRKTTAIEIGIRLLKDLDDVRIMHGKSSTEKFIVDLDWDGPKTETPPSTLVNANELSVFLTRDQQGEKLIDVLTGLFDCPDIFEYKTITRKEYTIRSPCVIVLAGTTPDSLGRVLPDMAVGGGFTSRIIFPFQGDTQRVNALPRLSPEEIEARDVLRTRLVDISGLRGPFHLTTDGSEFYTQWYESNGRAKPDDSRLDGFVGRKHDHILRIAMLLTASDAQGKGINEQTLIRSVQLINEVERYLPGALGEIGTHVEKQNTDLILRILHKAGGAGIAHSDLLRKVYGKLNAKGLREVMATLLESGLAERRPDAARFYRCMCDACKAARAI